MNIQFLLFENDDEEPEHSLTFDLPGVPQAGDRVTVSRPGQEGCSNFIVRRTQWDLGFPGDNTSHRVGEIIIGSTSAITVECSFVVGPYSSEEHKRVAPGI